MAEQHRHLDPLELDAHRSGEENPERAAHLAECLHCQAALAELNELANRLKSLHAPALAAAADRDARILWLARGQAARVRLAEPRGLRRVFGVPPARAAAAAAVLALASALFLARRSPPHGGGQLTQLAGAPPAEPSFTADLDGDGRVTVLDAFALARDLEAAPGRHAVDVNRDTRVDEQDVDTVMAMAVSVRGS